MANFLAAELSQRSRRLAIGGYERRSSERYESRLESTVKQEQRDEVAQWFIQHHRSGERMRVLSLPDEHWTFENQLNDRPNTSFLGLQRDWVSLERSVPWMPTSREFPSWSEENKASHFWTEAATGEIQGWRKGNNRIVHMWAGHLLSFDNIGHKKQGTLALRNLTIRSRTAAWLDFTGNLTSEVTSAFCGVPAFLGGKTKGKPSFPAVVSFLACRDRFSDHSDRVAKVLVSLQESQRRKNGWRFRFDRFTVHSGSSPFISIFGTFWSVNLWAEGDSTPGAQPTEQP